MLSLQFSCDAQRVGLRSQAPPHRQQLSRALVRALPRARLPKSHIASSLPQTPSAPVTLITLRLPKSQVLTFLVSTAQN